METMGRPYQVQVAQLQAENAQLKAELAQCRADKNEMVTRNKLLRDRPDLPLERLAAYDEIMNQLAQATQREARFREALVRIANHGPMMLARGEYRRGQVDMLGGIVRIAKQALEEAGT